jgi:acetyl-CoA carboxylase carboxyl transferase subunit alpha
MEKNHLPLVVRCGKFFLEPPDLLRLGVIDQIVPEPLGGAHRLPQDAIAGAGEAIGLALQPLIGVDGAQLRQQRRQKFLAMGAKPG